MSARVAGLRAQLTAPVDAASLGVFRIAFGLISAWEIWRTYDGNLIRVDYATPEFLFKWWAFEWVGPAPGAWLFVAFAVTGVAALFVAAGLLYRTAAVVHFLGVAYWFLMDKATYLNHRYLTGLIALLLVFMPANAAYSVDAVRKPWVRSPVVPAWSVWLLRLQVGVPYFFAGVAKMNFDWLVRAEPLGTWLQAQTDFPFVGRFFAYGAVAHGMAIASTVFDVLTPFLLLNRRTRAVAFGFVLGFHFLNSRLFEIGMFPWLMIVATTIFFEPDWPRRMWHALRAGRRGVVAAIGLGVLSGFIVGGFLPRSFSIVMAATGAFGVAVLAYHLLPERVRFCELPVHAARTPWRGLRLGRPTAIALIGFAALQVLLPMRHWLIPGNVAWTGEGQRFAWQLLVRQESGTARFRVSGPGSNAVGTLSIDDHLTSFQIAKMIVNPDLLVQFAQYLEAYYRSIGVTDDLEIRVEGEVSLNGRSRQPKIDPDVDLTSIRRPYLPPAPWIVPLRPYED